MPTFYVTKHALTSGILRVEANEPERNSIYWGGSFWNGAHGEGRDWHRSITAARARAEEMKARKIVSLKKQIEKLETTPIKIVEG